MKHVRLPIEKSVRLDPETAGWLSAVAAEAKMAESEVMRAGLRCLRQVIERHHEVKET